MDWTPRERLGSRLRHLAHEINAAAAADEQRDDALKDIVIEGFDTIESYARFIVAQNARIFEAIMHIVETASTDEQLAALTERLNAADKKLDAATG